MIISAKSYEVCCGRLHHCTSGWIVRVVGRASLQCWRDQPHSARLKNQAEVLLWRRDESGGYRLNVWKYTAKLGVECERGCSVDQVLRYWPGAGRTFAGIHNQSTANIIALQPTGSIFFASLARNGLAVTAPSSAAFDYTLQQSRAIARRSA
jgi:hypothetical protein